MIITICFQWKHWNEIYWFCRRGANLRLQDLHRTGTIPALHSSGSASLGACEALLRRKGWHCLLTWLHVADFSCSMTSLFFILSPAGSPDVNVYFLCMVSCDKILQANIAAPRCQPGSIHCVLQDRAALTDPVLRETDLIPSDIWEQPHWPEQSTAQSL